MSVTTVLEGKMVLFFASATARLLVPRFKPYLHIGWVLLQGSKNVGSVQNFILLFCVWCESRELGDTGSSRFSCITPLMETFSDGVTFRIPSNNSDGTPLQSSQRPLPLSVAATPWIIATPWVRFPLFHALLFFRVNESFIN